VGLAHWASPDRRASAGQTLRQRVCRQPGQASASKLGHRHLFGAALQVKPAGKAVGLQPAAQGVAQQFAAPA
jgi:hypothetical protein